MKYVLGTSFNNFDHAVKGLCSGYYLEDHYLISRKTGHSEISDLCFRSILHLLKSLPHTFAGAKLAIDLVNADNMTLPSHELVLIVNDTQCRADVAMSNFINLMLMKDHSFKILGILGRCLCI